MFETHSQELSCRLRAENVANSVLVKVFVMEEDLAKMRMSALLLLSENQGLGTLFCGWFSLFVVVRVRVDTHGR